MRYKYLIGLPFVVALGLLEWHSAAILTDEFGRDQFAVLAASMMMSLVRAAAMAALLFLACFLLVLAVEARPNIAITTAVQVSIDALDSVPIYVWVLAGISAMPKSPGLVTTAIFVIAGLPILYGTVQGVVRQISHAAYCEAAVSLGSPRWRIVTRHILPNAMPRLIPTMVHVFGAALAIYGGVGVFGFVNRQELDLGVLLLRGREQAGFSMIPLLLAICAYVGIFVALYATLQCLAGRNSSRIERT